MATFCPVLGFTGISDGSALTSPPPPVSLSANPSVHYLSPAELGEQLGLAEREADADGFDPAHSEPYPV